MDVKFDHNQRVIGGIFAMIGAIILVFIDQFTKWLAVTYLNPQNGGEDFILIENVFRLRYLENRGAAFGIMEGKSMFLIIIPIIVFLAIVWFYLRIPALKKFRYMKWMAVIISAGAIGNFIDRVRNHFVVDFFYFELIDFPVFNMADIYVVCGVILLMILYIFYYKEDELTWLWPSRKKEDA